MFSQALRASQSSFKSILSKAKRGFTSSNPHLSEMLENMSQNMKINNSPENLIILDRLSQTPYSTTFRAFDKRTRSFVAHRTILLNCPTAWSQIEMIMKQHRNAEQSSLFSSIISIHYEKVANHVEVLTGLDKTTMGDVASYLAHHPEKLNDEFLKELTTQLTELVYEAESLDYKFEGLDLQNLFIDLEENCVKVHDLSNFEQKTKNNGASSSPLEAISDALMKIAGTHKGLEFLKEINSVRMTEPLISRPRDRSTLISIIDNDYNNFVTQKLLKILEEKGSTRFIENATLLKEAVNQSNSDGGFGHIQALQQQKETLLNQAKYYKTLDQFEKASKCYAEAFKATRKIEILEKAQTKMNSESSPSEDSSTYKSPLVKYLESLPRPLTQVIFPALLMFLILLMCASSLERSQAAREPAPPSEAEIAAKKLEEEEKSREKRQRLIQTLKFGLSVAIVSLGLIL